jgi:hypothetical protein
MAGIGDGAKLLTSWWPRCKETITKEPETRYALQGHILVTSLPSTRPHLPIAPHAGDQAFNT